MTTKFQINDPSIESQWRAIILFGKNSATYKFAFAKALLELIDLQKNKISLEELSIPFANSIVEHLKFEHQLKSDEYKKMFEGAKVKSENELLKMSDRAKKNWSKPEYKESQIKIRRIS